MAAMKVTIGRIDVIKLSNNLMVGAAGFEPTTPCPPDKCATGLRYAPTELLLGSFRKKGKWWIGSPVIIAFP